MYILYLIAAPEYAQRFAKGLGVIACVAAEISCLNCDFGEIAQYENFH